LIDSTVGDLDLQRHFEAVAHRHHGLGEAFDGEFVGLADVFLGAAADVLGVGLGTHEGVVHFSQLGFGRAQLFFEARLGRRLERPGAASLSGWGITSGFS
jgi:hypothetical protein